MRQRRLTTLALAAICCYHHPMITTRWQLAACDFIAGMPVICVQYRLRCSCRAESRWKSRRSPQTPTGYELAHQFAYESESVTLDFGNLTDVHHARLDAIGQIQRRRAQRDFVRQNMIAAIAQFAAFWRGRSGRGVISGYIGASSQITSCDVHRMTACMHIFPHPVE